MAVKDRDRRRNRGDRRDRDRDRGGRDRDRGKGKKVGSLYNPRQVHSGKQLQRLAAAMAKLETQSEARAYGRLAKELEAQGAADERGLTRLGERADSKLGSVYAGYDQGAAGGTARAGAIGQMLGGQIQQGNEQAAALQQGVQTGQLGGLQEAMSLRGAPGGGQAQQQLQSLVDQQAQRQASEASGASAFAASQGAAFTGLAEGARQAGALQGAEARGDIQSTMAARIAESRLKAGQDIREARAKQADARSLRGERTLAHLGELMGSERDFLLGKQAVKTDRMSIQQDRAEMRSEQKQARLDRKHESRENRKDRRFDRSESRRERARDRRDREDEQKHDIELEHEGDKGEGGSGGSGDRRERQQDRRSAYGAARDIGRGRPPSELQEFFGDFVNEIKSRSGVDYRVARAMAQRYIRQRGG